MLATWCKELTHWERSKAGGEGNNRGWGGWKASLTLWTEVWVNSRSWWWTGKLGMLQSVELQRAGHDWATKLNWRLNKYEYRFKGCIVRNWSVSEWFFPCCYSVTQSCLTFVTPRNVALPVSSVHGISQVRIQQRSGLPFPFPGDLPNPGIESASPPLAGRFFTTEPSGKPDFFS